MVTADGDTKLGPTGDETDRTVEWIDVEGETVVYPWKLGAEAALERGMRLLLVEATMVLGGLQAEGRRRE